MTPAADDYTGADFEASLEEGDVCVQQCTRCDRPRFPPLPACPFCGAVAAHLVTLSGRGRVYSFVRVHVSPTGAFIGDTPYVVAAVDLDEGVRMFGRVVDDVVEGIEIGDVVTGRAERTESGTSVVFESPGRRP